MWVSITRCAFAPGTFDAHGTSVDNSLMILAEGQIMPSPGIAGHAVYCFAGYGDLNDDMYEHLWLHTTSDRYNQGAMFLARGQGVTWPVFIWVRGVTYGG